MACPPERFQVVEGQSAQSVPCVGHGRLTGRSRRPKLRLDLSFACFTDPSELSLECSPGRCEALGRARSLGRLAKNEGEMVEVGQRTGHRVGDGMGRRSRLDLGTERSGGAADPSRGHALEHRRGRGCVDAGGDGHREAEGDERRPRCVENENSRKAGGVDRLAGDEIVGGDGRRRRCWELLRPNASTEQGDEPEAGYGESKRRHGTPARQLRVPGSRKFRGFCCRPFCRTS